MSKEHRELHQAIADYALAHSIDQIPQLYYDRTAQTWHSMNGDGYDWDKSKAAAALLYAAVVDGLIHQSQMTPNGYRALDWAEKFMQKFEIVVAA